jgi:MT0933-like antitoxin protein
MPKIKNLAALVAAVEAGRRYARNNPDKAGKYVDQAAEFVDKQTKGKYSGQIDGLVGKVKDVAGLPSTPRHGVVGNGSVQGFETSRHGYGQSNPVTPPVTPSTTAPSTPITPSATSPSKPTSSTSTPPKPAAREPKPASGEPYPGSKDL